jgi:uncharacterized membrane protein YbhN (UPF0104 family)
MATTRFVRRLSSFSIRLARYVIAVAILAFLVRWLFANWSELSQLEWQVNYWVLILSIGLGVISLFLFAVSWKLTLRVLSTDLSWRQSLRVWMFSQAAKYIPGNIWNLVGRVHLSENENVPRSESIISVWLETLLLLTAISLLSTLILLSAIPTAIGYVVIASIVVLAGVLALQPVVFNQVLPKAISLISHREIANDFSITFRNLVGLLFSFLLAAVVAGGAFFSFVNAFYIFPIGMLPRFIGINSAALLLGMLVPFVPGGLGIREGVLTFLLSAYMPTSLAVVIALLSRIWAMAVEFIAVGITYLISSRVRGKGSD